MRCTFDKSFYSSRSPLGFLPKEWEPLSNLLDMFAGRLRSGLSPGKLRHWHQSAWAADVLETFLPSLHLHVVFKGRGWCCGPLNGYPHLFMSPFIQTLVIASWWVEYSSLSLWHGDWPCDLPMVYTQRWAWAIGDTGCFCPSSWVSSLWRERTNLWKHIDPRRMRNR